MRWKTGLVVSRVFPEMFRDLHVQHLADFFRDQLDGLSALAPVDGDEPPHIVLLTPGPYNETYFEHAYLARYLGFPLVEGQDLTVRGDAALSQDPAWAETRPRRAATSG
jgi:uncharacterized circularly permuted ATP-grasp superfamily protein